MPEQANVLIAGCGDLGAAVATLFRDAGCAVTTIRRGGAAFPEGVRGLRLDLSDPACADSIPGGDLIVHCLSPAGGTEDAYRAAYVSGLENLLSRGRGMAAQAVILVSSTGVYHQDDGSWVDEGSPTAPAHFRGRILCEAEALLAANCSASSAIRFGGIYGPGRGSFLDRVRAGLEASVDHVQYTNRIHREDCIGALGFLGRKALGGTALKPVYVATDACPAPRHEVINWLRERLGMPPGQEPPAGAPQRGKRCSNAGLLASGYRFRYPDYRAGYAAMIDAQAG